MGWGDNSNRKCCLRSTRVWTDQRIWFLILFPSFVKLIDTDTVTNSSWYFISSVLEKVPFSPPIPSSLFQFSGKTLMFSRTGFFRLYFPFWLYSDLKISIIQSWLSVIETLAIWQIISLYSPFYFEFVSVRLWIIITFKLGLLISPLTYTAVSTKLVPQKRECVHGYRY